MTETPPPPSPARPSRLPSAVLWFGVVSFLTDAASEMIYPLLPLFLTSVLAAPVTVIGAIEGVAEATAALFKLISGRIADAMPRKKPLVVAGYGLAALVRPLVSIATTWWQVLLIRFSDRVGKGIRSSPRDAIVAEATPIGQRGAAFGYHRSMDNAGAVLGPLLGYALWQGAGLELRTMFAWAAVPGLLALVALIFGVREPVAPPASDAAKQQKLVPIPPSERRALVRYLTAVAVFSLGNSSDAFLLVRAGQILHPGDSLGKAVLADPKVLLLWTLHNAVKALLSKSAGGLSDRLGRRRLIAAGWALYAVTYVAFGLADRPWQIWALFAVYGLYYSLVEGAEKALVADLAGPGRKGRAFGWFHGTVGIMALPASFLFGLIYNQWGALAAFSVSAVLAGVASLLLARVPAPSPTP